MSPEVNLFFCGFSAGISFLCIARQDWLWVALNAGASLLNFAVWMNS